MKSGKKSRLNDTWLRSIHVALPTPFDSTGRIIVERPLTTLVGRLLTAGIEVFLPAAANGEFHSLSDDEVLTCIRVTRDACGDRGIIVAPIGFDLRRSIALGAAAVDAGADVLLYMPPTHPYLNDPGFGELLRAISASSAAPLMVYKKGPCPSDELLVRLTKDNIVAGVKYSSPDPEAVAKFVVSTAGKGGVICGFGERYAPYYGLSGAVGFSSGAANIAPRVSLRLLSEIRSGKYAAAMDTLAILRPLEDFRAREGDSYNIPVLKGAMKFSGLDFGEPRVPQRKLTGDEERELGRVVEKLLAAEGITTPDAVNGSKLGSEVVA